MGTSEPLLNSPLACFVRARQPVRFLALLAIIEAVLLASGAVKLPQLAYNDFGGRTMPYAYHLGPVFAAIPLSIGLASTSTELETRARARGRLLVPRVCWAALLALVCALALVPVATQVGPGGSVTVMLQNWLLAAGAVLLLSRGLPELLAWVPVVAVGIAEMMLGGHHPGISLDASSTKLAWGIVVLTAGLAAQSLGASPAQQHLTRWLQKTQD